MLSVKVKKSFWEKLSELNVPDFFSDIRNTLAASTVLHLLLLLIFLLVNAGFRITSTEFAEINFIGGRAIQAKVQTGASKPIIATQQQEPEVAKPPVDLPRRRMLEDEAPELRATDKDKITPHLNDTPISEKLDAPIYDAKPDPGLTRDQFEKRANIVSEEPGTGTKETPGSEPFTPQGSDQFFSIEGDAAQRTIVHKIIPQYPAGLQREATIKVRFEVPPDGTITNMIPILKGEPTLEKLTLDALRQWRFNPIPPALEQKTVSGIITFRYVLK